MGVKPQLQFSHLYVENPPSLRERARVRVNDNSVIPAKAGTPKGSPLGNPQEFGMLCLNRFDANLPARFQRNPAVNDYHLPSYHLRIRRA